MWHSLVFRVFAAWLFAVLLPAAIMWHERIPSWQFEQTNINSFYAMSACVFVVVYLLNKITIFPGQRSYIYIFPVWLLALVVQGVLFFIFRLQYAVYFSTVSIILGIVFSFFSVSISKVVFRKNMAFIPLGRCKNFHSLPDVDWHVLQSPQLNTPQATKVDAIVADLSSSELTDEWQRFLAKQTLSGVPVYNNLQVHESLTGRSPIQHLYENNLGSLLPSQSYLYFKQFIETLIVILALPLVIPVMLLTYMIVRAEGAGSVIFVQERVGQGGKPFKMYKFRSMVVDAEKHGAQLAQKNDARITPFGHFIRKTRIDELPQIWNVLKGDMSLIGPRPEQKSFVEKFEKEIAFYSYRHIVKPGMTGWAQVMQGYAGNTDETLEKIQYDFYYIKHFSFTLDMMIVVKTAQIVFTGFGAR